MTAHHDYHMARLRIARLEEALDLYRDAVRVDVLMEGPRFMGSNASALRRAWEHDRAALAPPKTVDNNPQQT